jgi:hypothetical protein
MLSVLRLTDSDYHFGIFNLFFTRSHDVYLLLATLITLHGIRNANICTASSRGYSIIPLMKARSRAKEMRTITPSNN